MTKGLTLEFDTEVLECPCGSGKRPIKCCGKTKTRTTIIHMDERNFHESDGISFNLNGELKRNIGGKLHPLIGQPKISYGYKRKKGLKVLLSGNANDQFVMHNESVLQGYQNIFSIDTNTKKIDGNSISVSVIVHAYIEKIDDGFILNLAARTAFEFWNASVSPESLGLFALVNALLANEELADKSTGVIVDSDLGNLDSINNQKQEILNGLFLPEKYKLIYASSDVGVNGANKLIKLCDKKSNETLQHIRELSSKDNLVQSDEYPCEYFRQWVFNEESDQSE